MLQVLTGLETSQKMHSYCQQLVGSHTKSVILVMPSLVLQNLALCYNKPCFMELFLVG